LQKLSIGGDTTQCYNGISQYKMEDYKMKITKKIGLAEFEGWSGAEDTLSRVINEGKIDDLESILDDLYPDGMDETQLNDLLRFDDGTVFEWCGIRTEEQIKTDLEDAEEELSDKNQEYEDEAEDLETEDEKAKLYAEDYKDDIQEIKDRIKELKEELEEI